MSGAAMVSGEGLSQARGEDVSFLSRWFGEESHESILRPPQQSQRKIVPPSWDAVRFQPDGNFDEWIPVGPDVEVMIRGGDPLGIVWARERETHTEDTLFKVRDALHEVGITDYEDVLDVINAIQNRGILFRERKASLPTNGGEKEEEKE